MAEEKYKVGDKFNHWTLVAKLKTTINKSRRWRVRCDCGKVFDRYASNIHTGRSKACGSCGAIERERVKRGQL